MKKHSRVLRHFPTKTYSTILQTTRPNFFYDFRVRYIEIVCRIVTGTLNFADIEGWNVAETEGWKVADTIFSRDGKLPTQFFREMESCRHFFRVGKLTQ